MKLVLSDAERRLIGDGARYVEDHFDEIDPHFLHLSREDVAAAARFIAGQGEPIGTRILRTSPCSRSCWKGLRLTGA